MSQKQKTDEFSNRLLGIISEHFPASFSARHLARIYSEEYEEVTTQKVAAALDALWYNGFLMKQVVRKSRKGNKNRYHISDMKSKVKSKISKSRSNKHVPIDVVSR
jgi:hypothetical protein